MEKAVWDEKYSVNVKEIDEQHKNMIKFINDVNDNLAAGSDFKFFDDFFDELMHHTITHFETEERYFEKFAYEDAKVHIIEHNNIKKVVTELQKKYLDDPSPTVIFEVASLLEAWLMGHIMLHDKKYTKCFNDHGLL